MWAAVTSQRSAEGGLRGFVGRHEEALLYAVAAVVYIVLGVFLKTVILNWVVGPLFPLLVVYLIPTWVRRWRAREEEVAT